MVSYHRWLNDARSGGMSVKILVLAGGISTERDVSFVSGRCVYEALLRKGHQVILADAYLGLPGSYTDIPCSELFGRDINWTEHIEGISETAPDLDSIKAMRDPSYKGFLGPGIVELCREADVVFIALHGENGENGKLQAYLDLEGITYTGTDYISSAICMNKQLSKELLAYNGIPVPRGRVIRRGEDRTNTVGLPCVVKVCGGGSSVGVYICHDSAEYDRAVDEAFMLDDNVIVEEYIGGREFSVCVTDWEGEPKALPIIEIAPTGEFYDYKCKYQEGATVETCPADLPDAKAAQMSAYAERGFAALKLHSYARLDFLMRDTDAGLYCLEANTLPGMTPMSLVPQEARACGIEFDDLCEKIVKYALRED